MLRHPLPGLPGVCHLCVIAKLSHKIPGISSLIKGVRLNEFWEFMDRQQKFLGLHGETERRDQLAEHEVEKI